MQAQMLAPAAILVAWSLVMLFWMAKTRFPAIAKSGMDIANAKPGGRGQDLEGVLPDEVNWKAHNYAHLMEQPTIFYAAVVIIALMGASGFDVLAAWIYVALRIIHSIWQATRNVVKVRLLLFQLSTFALVYLAIRAIALTLFADPGSPRMIGMEILKPVVVLTIWTMVMWVWMYATRIPAMQKAKIDASGLVGTTGASLRSQLPDEVNWKADNYNHLHEQPTVFYAVAIVLAIIGQGDGMNALLAWIYVGLRVIHSLVQVTANRVMVRFVLFALSSVVLIALILHASMSVFGSSS